MTPYECKANEIKICIVVLSTNVAYRTACKSENVGNSI